MTHASAPPSPPPDDPTPVVANPVTDPLPARSTHPAVGSSGMLAWADPWDAGTTGTAITLNPVTGQVATSPADVAALEGTLARLAARAQLGADPRLTTFGALFAPTADRFLRAFAAELQPSDLLAALLRLF